MTRGSFYTPVFSSALAPVFERYVCLKRALGRGFNGPSRTLQSLDRFLSEQRTTYRDLDSPAFHSWCHTLEHLASGVRRIRMLSVRAFCLYRQRTEPECFVPDLRSFPSYHQRLKPYIFSESDIVKLLRAAAGLDRQPLSPLRPEVIRLAIILLFTTGVRRGELLGLTLGDYNPAESTLLIRETKFYKSRVLPINDGIAGEINQYLDLRARLKLSISSDTALIWNAYHGGRAYSGTALRGCLQTLFEKCGIRKPNSKMPRVHDFRHSFAVNALLRWYRAGADVESKLPMLATYLGHGSAVSTHYYLHFIEPLRTAASERFANHYGQLISMCPKTKRRSL